jgi:hypothetical protein
MGPLAEGSRFTGKNSVSPDSKLFHTNRAVMFRRRQRLAHTAKKAARPLAVCVVVILGATGLILLSMLRNQIPAANGSQFYSELPGVDLRQVAPARLRALLKRLNTQRCPCGCMRTVASCRNHHASCPESIAAARRAIAEQLKAP